MAKRKRYDSTFKANVALEAIKDHKTISQIASEYGIHPNQVTHWKKQLLSGVADLFCDPRKKSATSDPSVDELYRQIGQLADGTKRSQL